MAAFEQSPEIRLINQGTYGCVFHPGVTCEGDVESNQYVTKIQRNERTITNEWTISQKIRKIPSYTRYFVPILKKCDVKIKKDNAHNLRECNVFKDDSEEEIAESSYVSMKIRYVGNVTLRNYVLGVTLDNFVSELLNTHSYLLKALKTLGEAEIVHNDLRSNNIMYDTTRKTKHPLIIDFGLAFSTGDLTTTKLEKIFYVFDTYGFWCIDVIMCNYIVRVVGIENAKTQKVTTEELANVYDVFLHGKDPKDESSIENEAFTFKMLNHPEKMTQFELTYKEYFSKFIGKSWWVVYEYLTKYAKTWDNYSMAVIYLLFLDDIYQSDHSKYNQMAEPHSQVLKKYIDLLEDIVYAAPNKRLTVAETIKRFPKKRQGIWV